ncbi:uncharacterized protein H6S33_005340 [Morchella sextelata]|uniref:uncharacterized protein n=1 Tax=Morchella sextelata TaxID=1174677 RepID=UPI001D055D77|nr:uncharacterized protein H6S33_005340 [Morchella sextelata]KAH0613454.1 hypothetical protein H6S33_005340 [Morchella sextelata]
MESHGISRSEYTAQSRDEQLRARELKKITEYNGLCAQVLERRAANDLTPAALDLTSQLLRLNPEFYTIWNYRRQILLHTFLAPPPTGTPPSAAYHEALTAHLHNELTFLLPLLKTHPKCYWLWNHRLWTLHQSSPLPSNPFWSAELTLATHLLRRDVRNFHGWMYRRLLVAQIGGSLTEQEFAYTTAMLQGAGGMSNYSAWHQRSVLIPRLLEERGAGEQERMDFLEDELVLVRRYTTTNPWDSAVWFYHWWLVGSSAVGEGGAVVVGMERGVRLLMVGEEVEVLRGLLAEQGGCRFVVKALVGCVGLLWRVRRQPRGEGEEEDDEEEEVDEEKEKVEVKGWIEKLIELDPMRAGRYRDLEKELWALLV